MFCGFLRHLSLDCKFSSEEDNLDKDEDEGELLLFCLVFFASLLPVPSPRKSVATVMIPVCAWGWKTCLGWAELGWPLCLCSPTCQKVVLTTLWPSIPVGRLRKVGRAWVKRKFPMKRDYSVWHSNLQNHMSGFLRGGKPHLQCWCECPLRTWQSLSQHVGLSKVCQEQ